MKTQACGRDESKTRLAQARKFLEVAELVATEEAIPESASVCASLAVLAGIAASDAMCCAALGKRARGQDHHEAESLLKLVEPNGAEAAVSLRRLLDLKDPAHYGLIHMSGKNLKVALRQSSALVDFAARVVAR